MKSYLFEIKTACNEKYYVSAHNPNIALQLVREVSNEDIKSIIILAKEYKYTTDYDGDINNNYNDEDDYITNDNFLID